ncbi:MAG: hypothetical protein HQL56_08575 [Magnetococcales bacterium]|nr:hypothetical protein [Magnetococcales bacterium]
MAVGNRKIANLPRENQNQTGQQKQGGFQETAGVGGEEEYGDQQQQAVEKDGFGLDEEADEKACSEEGGEMSRKFPDAKKKNRGQEKPQGSQRLRGEIMKNINIRQG